MTDEGDAPPGVRQAYGARSVLERVVAALGGPDALRAILGALARALPAKKKRRAA
jgi:hypothetical protein